MDALGDLVARDRRSADPALLAPRENRRYDYHRFCTTVWKTGNFWRRRGVHASDEGASVGSSRAERSDGVSASEASRGTSDERSAPDSTHDGATIAVADDPAPEAVFSFLGAALLGAKSRFGLSDPVEAADLSARVIVAPSEEIGDYEVPPGSQRVGYGGPPDDPSIAHFERDVWSENPSFPETPIDSETVAVVDEGDEFTHFDLLTAAGEVADDWGLEPGDEVAVRAPLADPGTVVAGVVAPLLAGAAMLLPDEGATGDFAVVANTEDSSGEQVPESETVAASAVV